MIISFNKDNLFYYSENGSGLAQFCEYVNSIDFLITLSQTGVIQVTRSSSIVNAIFGSH